MIELRRPPQSPAADEIADALREMVVAFREVEDASLTAPLIREGETRHSKPAEISAFLGKLEADVASWNAFQSDACFIGDDGRPC